MGSQKLLGGAEQSQGWEQEEPGGIRRSQEKLGESQENEEEPEEPREVREIQGSREEPKRARKARRGCGVGHRLSGYGSGSSWFPKRFGNPGESSRARRALASWASLPSYLSWLPKRFGKAGEPGKPGGPGEPDKPGWFYLAAR